MSNSLKSAEVFAHRGAIARKRMEGQTWEAVAGWLTQETGQTFTDGHLRSYWRRLGKTPEIIMAEARAEAAETETERLRSGIAKAPGAGTDHETIKALHAALVRTQAAIELAERAEAEAKQALAAEMGDGQALREECDLWRARAHEMLESANRAVVERDRLRAAIAEWDRWGRAALRSYRAKERRALEMLFTELGKRFLVKGQRPVPSQGVHKLTQGSADKIATSPPSRDILKRLSQLILRR